MAAMLSFCFDLAYVQDGRWLAREAGLLALCQEVSDQVAEQCPAWEPDRDNWLAEQVADVLLGKVRALNGVGDETEFENDTGISQADG